MGQQRSTDHHRENLVKQYHATVTALRCSVSEIAGLRTAALPM